MLDPSLLENLDCSWPDDLRAYANKLRDSITAEADNEDDHTIDLLRRYAMEKAEAMEYRASGKIQMAIELEKECDRIYKLLPDYAKW